MLPKLYCIYILASGPRAVLYVGMTSDLSERTRQHRERLRPGFTTRYWVDRLVYFEMHADPVAAAKREQVLKKWRRDWKIALIEKANPTWRDLYAELLDAGGFEP